MKTWYKIRDINNQIGTIKKHIMKRSIYKTAWVLTAIIVSVFSSRCEFDEPFPDPSADFTIWGINPVSNAYEQVTEPFTLIKGVVYDFIVEGSGQQFVFWFGVAGDPESNTPSGSDFNDRGLNHLSSGVVARDKKAKNTYNVVGTYEVVLVASSYKYSTDEYKESITKKTLTVTEAK
jgi:hypothetical protein